MEEQNRVAQEGRDKQIEKDEVQASGKQGEEQSEAKQDCSLHLSEFPPPFCSGML